jgi:hypothetical protein
VAEEEPCESPCLLILPSLSLPPLEFCFGTSPTQAEKSRPDRKAFGSAMLGTKAGRPVQPNLVAQRPAHGSPETSSR